MPYARPDIIDSYEPLSSAQSFAVTFFIVRMISSANYGIADY